VAISEQIDAIVETVKIALEQTPARAVRGHRRRGIILTARRPPQKPGQALAGRDQPADHRGRAPAGNRGARIGKALDNLDLLKEIVVH